MQSLAKKWGGHLAALLLFMVVTIAYFSPSVLDGKVIHQGDMLKFSGMSEELNKHAAEAKDGNIIAWTGSMFSGMPSYNIAVKGTAPEYLFYLEIVDLVPEPVAKPRGPYKKRKENAEISN